MPYAARGWYGPLQGPLLGPYAIRGTIWSPTEPLGPIPLGALMGPLQGPILGPYTLGDLMGSVQALF